MRRTILPFLAAGLLPAIPAMPATAQGIGCEVILCLAGGFPGPDCSPAKSYFKKALRKDFNPFKPCKKASARGVAGDYEVPTRWGHRTIGPYCSGTMVTDHREGGSYCSGTMMKRVEAYVSITIPGGENSALDIPGYTPTAVSIPGVDPVADYTAEYIYYSYTEPVDRGK